MWRLRAVLHTRDTFGTWIEETSIEVRACRFVVLYSGDKKLGTGIQVLIKMSFFGVTLSLLSPSKIIWIFKYSNDESDKKRVKAVMSLKFKSASEGMNLKTDKELDDSSVDSLDEIINWNKYSS